MIPVSIYKDACHRALQMIETAGIILTDSDRKKIVAADFGLNDLMTEGIQILTLYETERMAAKILVLFANQTEPEHWHPPFGDNPGKEEVIRAIWGDLYFYIPGEDTLDRGFIVKGKEDYYTMRREIDMKPGDQLILPPGTKHWFQAGERGAVMYSFSTTVKDGKDEFTDPGVIRETVIGY